MLTFAVSLIAISGFVFAFVVFRVVPVSNRAIAGAREGALAMLDNTLSDDDKERMVRRAGLDLLAGGVQIFWRISACLVVAAAPVFLLDAAGYVSAEAVLALMLRWEYILGTTVVLGGAGWIFAHLRK